MELKGICMTNQKNNFSHLSFIDLTHALSPSIPNWDGGCGFQHTVTTEYYDCTGDTKFRVQKLEMAAGIGTHIDAPAHCISGATDIANIPLEQLIAPCVMIDVSKKAHESYRVTIDDIFEFESNYGEISKGSFIIIRTGWDKFWNDPSKYRNNLLFPTISLEAATLLLERDMVGLGIDTLSPDNETDGFSVHRLVLGTGKYIIENIANAGALPPVGAHTFALPLKIQDGTESPIRLIAGIYKDKN